MVNGRNKGSAFERQVAKLLEAELGIAFKRDLEQYRAGDHGDLIADDPDFPFIVECKRYAQGTGCRASWWAQANAAANAVGKLPCVVYKYDRRDIRCVVSFTALYSAFGSECKSDHQAEVTLETLCWIAREIMAGNDD
jgi:Holliday junction resolvase